MNKPTQEALSANLSAADQVSDAALVWISHDGRFLDVDARICQWLGYRREELRAMAVWDIDPEFPSAHWRAHWQELRESRTLRFQMTSHRRDGARVPVEITAHYVKLDSYEHVCALIQPITAQKRTEDALRQSEERLALALAVSGQGLYDLNFATGKAIFSDEYARMLGYEPSELELTPATWASWLHPDERERVLRLYEDCVTGQQAGYQAEFRLRTRAGAWIWVLSRSKIVERDAVGQPRRMVGVNLNITERKRTEEALQQNAQEMQWLMKSMVNAFVVWESVFDAAGQFINFRFAYFNDAYARISGLKLDEVRGKTVLEVWPETEQSWFEVYGEVAMTGNPKSFEMYHAPTRGLYACNAYRPWDTPDRICVVFEDITAHKRAEEELERYRNHLEELVAERTAELRQAMTQLVQAEKLAALGHLVAGVAHELNSPLGNARVVASALGEDLHEFAAAVESGVLRRSQVDAFLERGREAVDLLERNAVRAADLISHFKQVAVDQTSMRRRSFNLRQIVEELLVTLQPQFKRTAHRVELAIPPELELDSYPGSLEQVLANLISNSLVHGLASLDAGVIRIQAMPRDAGYIQIDYMDNGVGISEKILKRIFDPFFTTKTDSGGSGLGLYIVYNVVTGILGGTIQAYSQQGQGATFSLVLPRIVPDQPALEPSV